MQIIETRVYTLDELDDKAKERAREWYREGGFDYEWFDSVYDDAKRMGRMMGIEIDRIYFSGFWSQGDGACFEGSYSYVKGGAAAVKAEAAAEWTRDGVTHKCESNARLHSIADSLQAIQRTRFYQLSASVKQSGRYSHEFCTEINVYDDSQGQGDYADPATHDAIADSLRDFMRWIYRALETEWDYLTSDESVDETIRCNEYTFDETGRRFG